VPITSEVPKTIKAIRGDTQGWFQAWATGRRQGERQHKKAPKLHAVPQIPVPTRTFLSLAGASNCKLRCDSYQARKCRSVAEVKVMQPRTRTRDQGDALL
jgi:hypothetical protein